MSVWETKRGAIFMDSVPALMKDITKELQGIREGLAQFNEQKSREEDVAPVDNGENTISPDRCEDLVIAAIEWTISCSEQMTQDMLRAMSITGDELEALGYDRKNFPEMHQWSDGGM